MSKSTYLNQDQTWWLIENNLPLDRLYPNKMNSKNIDNSYEKFIEPILQDGEQYALLTDNLEDYVITSYGRMFNCKTKNQVKSLSSEAKLDDIRIDIRRHKVLLKPLFEEQGWSFNAKQILKQYEK
jgi:hypothetical protein